MGDYQREDLIALEAEMARLAPVQPVTDRYGRLSDYELMSGLRLDVPQFKEDVADDRLSPGIHLARIRLRWVVNAKLTSYTYSAALITRRAKSL